MLGFVQTINKGLKPAALAQLFTALVLLLLEYCWPAWSPRGASAQATLETIQRRPARLLPHDVPTTQLLRQAKWSTLSHRRDVATLRLLAHVISPVVSQDEYLCSVHRRNERNGRIDTLFARTQRHDNLCLLRGVRLFRCLPLRHHQTFLTNRDEVTQLCTAAAKHL